MFNVCPRHSNRSAVVIRPAVKPSVNGQQQHHTGIKRAVHAEKILRDRAAATQATGG